MMYVLQCAPLTVNLKVGQMGLGKTITCVSLIAATLDSAKAFASEVVDLPPPLPDILSHQEHGGAQNAYEVAKGKAKAARAQEKFEAEYTRASRIKVKSRASLIVCPLSTVSNWEDQFREHWKGEVSVVGGGGSCTIAPTPSPPKTTEEPLAPRNTLIRKGTPLRIYIYHGNARRPDPTFLANFDAVITTYATLASEFSKQNRCLTAEEEEEGVSSDGVTLLEVDGYRNPIAKPPKPKKNTLKRKKSGMPVAGNSLDLSSPLQSVHWFRVVLDEAQ
jgi:SWI/SNF-related matrix-associated actin-dependent regulator of chromatin subfamily A3